MFRQNKKLIAGVIIGMLMTVSMLYAYLPSQFDYQGRLMGTVNGNPVSGTKTITFKLYDNANGGNLLWSETHSVEVTNGLFKVSLGSINPFPENLFDNVSLFSANSFYFVTVVEADDEMTPRTKINSVPYAMTDGDWAKSGDDMYSALSGNVGIGTETPTAKLDVDGGSETAVSVNSNGSNSTVIIENSNTTNHAHALEVSSATALSTVDIVNSSGGSCINASTYNSSPENSPTVDISSSSNGPGLKVTNLNGGNAAYIQNAQGTTADALYVTTSGSGRAGYFNGDVHVNGTFSKNAGSFLIDHPYDPANKYLAHSFVESPDMMNVYNGNVILDNKGVAIVELPYYFENINMEFRYQLTPLGSSAPNLYIAEEIRNNKFKIAGGKSGIKVSWQVTGIRNDPYAKEHRIQVESDKPDHEKGKYLNPELFGLGKEKGINYEQPKGLIEK